MRWQLSGETPTAAASRTSSSNKSSENCEDRSLIIKSNLVLHWEEWPSFYLQSSLEICQILDVQKLTFICWFRCGFSHFWHYFSLLFLDLKKHKGLTELTMPGILPLRPVFEFCAHSHPTSIFVCMLFPTFLFVFGPWKKLLRNLQPRRFLYLSGIFLHDIFAV